MYEYARIRTLDGSGSSSAKTQLGTDMVRISLVLSLAASALAALFKAKAACPDVIPGAYIFERNEGYASDALDERLSGLGRKRMSIDSTIYNATSVQIDDVRNGDRIAAMIAQDASVKAYSPFACTGCPGSTGDVPRHPGSRPRSESWET
ncbi:hypothetical protein RJ55_01946 [Drechmeria coniospora]|nr:hypothetical protein RJ55_01946 [Drechmeria coniospora]